MNITLFLFGVKFFLFFTIYLSVLSADSFDLGCPCTLKLYAKSVRNQIIHHMKYLKIGRTCEPACHTLHLLIQKNRAVWYLCNQPARLLILIKYIPAASYYSFVPAGIRKIF